MHTQWLSILVSFMRSMKVKGKKHKNRKKAEGNRRLKENTNKWMIIEITKKETLVYEEKKGKGTSLIVFQPSFSMLKQSKKMEK